MAKLSAYHRTETWRLRKIAEGVRTDYVCMSDGVILRQHKFSSGSLSGYKVVKLKAGVSSEQVRSNLIAKGFEAAPAS